MPVTLPVSRIVVTLDGLAGSGKSSLASALAAELGYLNFNSGLLYRTVGYLALTEKVSADDEAALAAMLSRHQIELVEDTQQSVSIVLDGKPLRADVRSPEVSEATSRSSRFAAVRDLLLDLQRGAHPDRNLVAEGRDMGTVVFPAAQVKFFVQASVDVRVKRRLRQLAAENAGLVTPELSAKITKEITERDARDTDRAVAPTVAATGSIVIDNSERPLAETVAEMAKIVRDRINCRA